MILIGDIRYRVLGNAGSYCRLFSCDYFSKIYRTVIFNLFSINYLTQKKMIAVSSSVRYFSKFKICIKIIVLMMRIFLIR